MRADDVVREHPGNSEGFLEGQCLAALREGTVAGDVAVGDGLGDVDLLLPETGPVETGMPDPADESPAVAGLVIMILRRPNSAPRGCELDEGDVGLQKGHLRLGAGCVDPAGDAQRADAGPDLLGRRGDEHLAYSGCRAVKGADEFPEPSGSSPPRSAPRTGPRSCPSGRSAGTPP